MLSASCLKIVGACTKIRVCWDNEMCWWVRVLRWDGGVSLSADDQTTE
jgi:hypothetical protein